MKRVVCRILLILELTRDVTHRPILWDAPGHSGCVFSFTLQRRFGSIMFGLDVHHRGMVTSATETQRLSFLQSDPQTPSHSRCVAPLITHKTFHFACRGNMLEIRMFCGSHTLLHVFGLVGFTATFSTTAADEHSFLQDEAINSMYFLRLQRLPH